MDFFIATADGEEHFTAGPGQIALIPGGLVHREENLGEVGCLSVVVRNSETPTVVTSTQ